MTIFWTEGPSIGDLRADRDAATSAWCDGPLSECQPALFAADFGSFAPTKAQCPAALAECGLDDDVRPLRKSEPHVKRPHQVGHSNTGSIFNTTAGPPSKAALDCLRVARHCSYFDFPSHPSGFVGTPEDGPVTLSIEGTSLFGCVILLQDQRWGFTKPWHVPNIFASLLSSSSSLTLYRATPCVLCVLALPRLHLLSSVAYNLPSAGGQLESARARGQGERQGMQAADVPIR